MRFLVAFFLLICLFSPVLTTAQPTCLPANSTNTTSSGPNQPIRANRTAEINANITNVPILPPFPTPTLNATQLGCPEENAVCPVVDFHLSANPHHTHSLTRPPLSRSPLQLISL